MINSYDDGLKAGRTKVSLSTNKGGEYAGISIEVPTDLYTKEVSDKFDELWQLIYNCN